MVVLLTGRVIRSGSAAVTFRGDDTAVTTLTHAGFRVPQSIFAEHCGQAPSGSRSSRSGAAPETARGLAAAGVHPGG